MPRHPNDIRGRGIGERRQPPGWSQVHGNPATWWDDHDELIGFARWYFDGWYKATDVLDFFEKPWKWDNEYQGYKEDSK